MSSTKEYALIEIKISTDRLSNFSSHSSSWSIGHSSIVPFDFDNHSETYTIDLALKLIDHSDQCFLFVNQTQDVDQLGSISKFFNSVTRKFREKVAVVYLSENKKLKPFFKVLQAKKCVDHKDAKSLFDTWIKELETDPNQPEKETAL
ncbi:MAG: hypothetical protein RIF33_08945 [Cyclobacteriaceae bacterium]